jgi:hypothetical protein
MGAKVRIGISNGQESPHGSREMDKKVRIEESRSAKTPGILGHFSAHNNPQNPTRVGGGWCGVGNAATPNPSKAMGRVHVQPHIRRLLIPVL